MKAKLGALLLVAGTVCGSLAAENWKVNPGVGLGPIALGQDYKQVNQYLTPHEAIPGVKGRAYLRYKEGVDVETENQKIIQIVVRQSNFTSPKAGPISIAIDGNLKIGSPVQQMEMALGRNYLAQDLKVAKSQPRETYYAYQSKGIGVLAREGRIIEFAIWPRK